MELDVITLITKWSKLSAKHQNITCIGINPPQV